MTALALAAIFFAFKSRGQAATSFALELAAKSAEKANNQLPDALLLGVASTEQQVRYETIDNLWTVR